jgi:hypothetical protein
MPPVEMLVVYVLHCFWFPSFGSLLSITRLLYCLAAMSMEVVTADGMVALLLCDGH